MEIEVQKADVVPGKRLSISQVRMWLKCPRQWAYRYVMGIKSPPGWALLMGSAWDDTLNVHNTEKMASKGLPLDVAQDLFKHSLQKQVEEKGEPMEADTDIKQEIDTGVGAVKAYMATHDPIVQPVAVQKKIEAPVGGMPMLGFIDLVRKTPSGNIVSDNKMTGKKPMELTAASSMQLAYYAEAEGTDHVELVHTIKYKRGAEVFVQPHFVTPAQRKELHRTVRYVARQIETKMYPQISPEQHNTENAFPCSAKWCGYWSICRGAKSGEPLPIPGEMEV